jgi:hypothetical protein
MDVTITANCEAPPIFGFTDGTKHSSYEILRQAQDDKENIFQQAVKR